MDLIGNANIKQALEDLQAYPEYRKVLSVLLKNEIYLLLQRLSETGEESIVMTASVSDGSMSVIGSNYGERFVLEPGNAVNLVTGFKEQFARYCHNETVTPPKRLRNYSYQYDEMDASTLYPDSVTDETRNAAVKSRLKHKAQREHRDDAQSPSYNPDDSDKAIDETVSELVKNILKQSEERERELGENGGRRRRRRRRRTFGDQNFSQNATPYSRRTYRKQRELKVAQFFPSIPLKRVDSEQNVGDKQEMPTGVKIKTEPIDTYFTEVYPQSDSTKKRLYNRKHDKKEIYPLVSVEKSVDKSIQKIIDMETKSGPSDSELNDVGNEELDKHKTEERNGTDEKHMEEKVKRIIEQVAKDSEQKRNSSSREEKSRENSVSQITNKIKIVRQSADGGHKVRQITPGEKVVWEQTNGDEIDTLVKESDGTKSDINDREDTHVEIEIDTDDVNFTYDDDYIKNEDDLTEQFNQSFEDSSAEDGIDDVCSPSYRRKVGRNFVHKGFSYIRDKAGKGNTIYWKCGRMGCKGRVIQRGGEKIRTQDHNHNPVIDFERDKAS